MCYSTQQGSSSVNYGILTQGCLTDSTCPSILRELPLFYHSCFMFIFNRRSQILTNDLGLSPHCWWDQVQHLITTGLITASPKIFDTRAEKDQFLSGVSGHVHSEIVWGYTSCKNCCTKTGNWRSIEENRCLLDGGTSWLPDMLVQSLFII